MDLIKKQIITAVLFFCFASLMLGYELGSWLAHGWRFNGLLITALCCSLYGRHLLANSFEQATAVSQ